MSHPYFCYIHQGLYVASPTLEGCQHNECLTFAKKEVAPAGIHMARFGGSTATKQARDNSDQFHRDMYAYKAALEAGVEPEMVTVKASRAALAAAEAKDQRKALEAKG